MLTLNNFKTTLINKAKLEGITENFGQAEIRLLEKKYKPNSFGNTHERQVSALINELDNWCMNFDLSMIN